MDETLEYWEACLKEFEEALELEIIMPERNHDMYKLLKEEISMCEQNIKELV